MLILKILEIFVCAVLIILAVFILITLIKAIYKELKK